jgi:hypothetical protein
MDNGTAREAGSRSLLTAAGGAGVNARVRESGEGRGGDCVKESNAYKEEPSVNALDTDLIIDSTSPAPRKSGRRWLALAAAAVSLFGITAGLVLTAPDDGATPRIVDMPVEDSPPTSAPRPKALTDTSHLELNRIGPIVVGMTVDEASAAHGKPVAIDSRTLGPGWKRGCGHALAEGGPEGLRFMVMNGTIVRIEVGRGPVATREGITTGSPVEDVFAAYAGRIRVEPHTYSARTGGQYLIVDEISGGTPMSILFETDGSRVTQFRSGLTNWVMAPEGCT